MADCRSSCSRFCSAFGFALQVSTLRKEQGQHSCDLPPHGQAAGALCSMYHCWCDFGAVKCAIGAVHAAWFVVQDEVWQAMLMHELGHCIDVHVYGRWAFAGLIASPSTLLSRPL